MKLPVSVCMISGNEASRIGKALASVADWAAEIIVVLNEDATDGTDKIAAAYGAKIFREPWKGHVAQKNSALEKATQPWALGLDSDEAVSAALREQIKAVITGSNQECDAYSFPRLSYYCGRWIRHGDWYPDRQVRLCRGGKAKWGGIDPHDKLIAQGAVGKLSGNLHHYSCENINGQIGKVTAFSDDFVRHALATGQSYGLFHLTVRPVWRFLRSYLFRLGFLDGWQGWYIAWVTAFLCVTRYAKAREAAENKQPPTDTNKHDSDG
jgi:glycosyltransferase involved in cell wall biosynthesis